VLAAYSPPRFARLDAEAQAVQGELAMKEAASGVPPAPEGWHTVTPRIVVHEARHLVEFLKQVFGATGEYRQERPAEVRIGDSVIMISDAGTRRPMTGFLYVYVNDTAETYRRALDAGARSLEDPSVTPYGDRRCMVEDKWGNTWQIATRMRSGDGA
jgi:PhnB protein